MTHWASPLGSRSTFLQFQKELFLYIRFLYTYSRLLAPITLGKLFSGKKEYIRMLDGPRGGCSTHCRWICFTPLRQPYSIAPSSLELGKLSLHFPSCLQLGSPFDYIPLTDSLMRLIEFDRDKIVSSYCRYLTFMVKKARKIFIGSSRGGFGE